MQNLGPCPEHLHPSPADSEPGGSAQSLGFNKPLQASLGRRLISSVSSQVPRGGEGQS